MSRLRLAIVTTGLAQGGAEAMLVKLVDSLDKAQFEVTVICVGRRAYNSDYLDRLGITTVYLNLQRWYNLPQALYSAAAVARRSKFDIVQGWMYHGNLLAHWISTCSKARAPVILGIRKTLPTLKNETLSTAGAILLDAFLSRRSVYQVFNSQQAIADHARLGYKIAHARLVPNGFDKTKFIPDRKAAVAMRQKLGLPESAFLVGFFGRFHPQKDFKLLIDAFAEFTRRSPNTNSRLVLAGTDVDSSNRQLCAWLDLAKVTRQSVLLGARSDIPALLAMVDVFCQTSRFGEGFPNALGEAMLAEKICVATNVGESAAIVADTGFIVEPGDLPGVVGALETICRMDEDEKHLLGTKARGRIVDKYNMAKVTMEYSALYAMAVKS
jgi:glycosyltransferase involved in cell wall biosynthesis